MKIVTITINIPERQKDYLKDKKSDTGLNMSDYLRRLIDKDMETNGGNNRIAAAV